MNPADGTRTAAGGTTTTIFAAKFNRDIELSVKLESVSTLLSLLTMPIIVSIAQYFK